ncbi:MAG: acyl-CoA dehydrogenase family protein [Myxococcales bacterium]|nr:acyl-CoA dehydrogenase family protein [Myxococcales bacterium]
MTASMLDRARELRTFIDAQASKTESSELPKETVDALVGADLFGVLTPKEVGGSELSICELLDVFAEVARADGSAGWCLMAGASTIGYFGAYAEEPVVSELFADGVPLAAGQFAPNGTATPDGGGFRVSGNYQFGSGMSYAKWAGAGFLVLPEAGSDAPATYLFGITPRDNIEVKGNWDVLGLVSTASYDYAMDDVYIPKEATFLFAAPTRRRGGEMYEIGVIGLTAIGHSGFAIGVVRRALDELRSIAKTKVRMGATTSLNDSERFLHAIGTLESRYHAATTWVYQIFTELEQDVRKTGKVNPKLCNVVRQATVHVNQEGANIVHEAYLLAGTTGLRNGPLQRCFRDIHAGSQHFFASPASTLDYARDLMADTPSDGVDA